MHQQDEKCKFIHSFCFDKAFRHEIISISEPVVFEYQKQLIKQYLIRRSQLVSGGDKSTINADALDFLKSRW